MLVDHLDGVAFDGYAPFPFQVHVIKDLVLQILADDCAGEFQQPVGQGAFAMVDMGNDAKVSDPLHQRAKVRLIFIVSLRDFQTGNTHKSDT
jgi:hypothetical protein